MDVDLEASPSNLCASRIRADDCNRYGLRYERPDSDMTTVVTRKVLLRTHPSLVPEDRVWEELGEETEFDTESTEGERVHPYTGVPLDD